MAETQGKQFGVPPQADGLLYTDDFVPTAEQDWLYRSTLPLTIWAHDFRSDAEVDSFRWSEKYGGGQDPFANGESGPDIRRITSDGVTGGGCLEAWRPNPDPDGDNRSFWWRPLKPLTSPGNGLAQDDHGAGSITPRNYVPTDGGNEVGGVTDGYYGHPTYQSNWPGRFDGTTLYLQVRVKMDPRRYLTSDEKGGKSVWFTTTFASLTGQELVTYSLDTGGNQGLGNNYWNLYRGNDFLRIGLINPARPTDTQPGNETGNDWFYSNGWDVLHYEIRNGIEGVATGPNSTYMKVSAGTAADIAAQAGYTVICDGEFSQSGYTGTIGENNPFGHNALMLANYNNFAVMNSEFYQRYDQVILSQAPIPFPKA